MKQYGSAGFQSGVSFSSLNGMTHTEVVGLNLRFLLPPSLDVDDVFEDDFGREIIELSVDMIATNFSGSTRSQNDGLTYSTKCALPLASQWLKNCRKAHWKCNIRREQITPNRLVTTDKSCIRLRLREDFQDPPEYATLSHCWGEKRFVTLKKQNLDNFKERIPQEALPQTFMDAILIARELGVQYIWIDSLCIIQDDTDDWLQEAATMSSVYGESTLNIAASGARDGAAGCFLRPQHTLRCQIQVESGGRTLRYSCVPRGLYYHTLSDMPLMRRGWTLQERLLPSRNLHFTSTQVFWECYQKVACEMFPDEFPHSLAYSDYYFQKQPVSISMWSWIAQRYSSCNLTRTEDKLVAISGFAREIQSQTRDQYVAGMWRKDLEFQLCWETLVGQKCQRITPYRAPTWSWASLNCRISIQIAKRFESTAENTFRWIKVLNIRLRFAGPDTLGQISAANLRLGCRSLLHVALEKGYIFMAKKKVKAIIRIDEGNTAGILEAVALPVFGSSRNGQISGLFIEPTKQEKGQYRRLGSFRIYASKYCKAFEAASTERSYWVGSSDLVKIRDDKFGNTHRIINMI
ncbi:heterokaryon incompatibility protein-domain-containing protein [Paraphoma chrysanthemicola]|nr:heterokaryon incompatibility protein-domain-containing protein [Paraphoma chrysanthemicola]